MSTHRSLPELNTLAEAPLTPRERWSAVAFALLTLAALAFGSTIFG